MGPVQKHFIKKETGKRALEAKASIGPVMKPSVFVASHTKYFSGTELN